MLGASSRAALSRSKKTSTCTTEYRLPPYALILIQPTIHQNTLQNIPRSSHASWMPRRLSLHLMFLSIPVFRNR